MLDPVGFGRSVARTLLQDDRGASMVEYGLLLMLIALVVIPMLIVLGPLVAALYTGVVGP